MPGLSGFLGARSPVVDEGDGDGDGDGDGETDEVEIAAAVSESDDDIDLSATTTRRRSEFPDIVSALGVELEEQPVEAEPDEIDPVMSKPAPRPEGALT